MIDQIGLQVIVSNPNQTYVKGRAKEMAKIMGITRRWFGEEKQPEIGECGTVIAQYFDSKAGTGGTFVFAVDVGYGVYIVTKNGLRSLTTKIKVKKKKKRKL